jgi:hypothetical protein
MNMFPRFADRILRHEQSAIGFALCSLGLAQALCCGRDAGVVRAIEHAGCAFGRGSGGAVVCGRGVVVAGVAD